jgi:hypothetical protein
MNNEDKREFAEMLTAMAGLYGKPTPDKPMLAMYFIAMQSISIDDFRQAANLHVIDTDQGQFFPKPADILRNVHGNKGTRAEQAWTKVDKAIKHVGPYQSVVFDDALIHAVINDMGGWIGLCNSDEEEYPFKHNEFVKRYGGFINRKPDSIPPKLIGLSESTNSHEGRRQHIEPPMLIGDPSKARLVLQNESGSGRVGITSLGGMASISQLIAKGIGVDSAK